MKKFVLSIMLCSAIMFSFPLFCHAAGEIGTFWVGIQTTDVTNAGTDSYIDLGFRFKDGTESLVRLPRGSKNWLGTSYSNFEQGNYNTFDLTLSDNSTRKIWDITDVVLKKDSTGLASDWDLTSIKFNIQGTTFEWIYNGWIDDNSTTTYSIADKFARKVKTVSVVPDGTIGNWDIPQSSGASKTFAFAATPKDQYGETYEPSTTVWTTNIPQQLQSGISFANSALTITNSTTLASKMKEMSLTYIDISVTASNSGVYGTYTARINKPTSTVSAVNITSDSSNFTVPAAGQTNKTIQFSAEAYDQYGVFVNSTWSLNNAPQGVSISSTGKLTITSQAASAQSAFDVVATAADKTQTYSVTLLKPIGTVVSAQILTQNTDWYIPTSGSRQIVFTITAVDQYNQTFSPQAVWSLEGDSIAQSTDVSISNGVLTVNSALAAIAPVTFKVVAAADGKTFTYDVALYPKEPTDLTYTKDVTTKKGSPPVLPEKATFTYEDNSQEDVVIVWDAVPQSAYSTCGDYEINGTANGYPVTVTLHVEEDDSIERIECQKVIATTINVEPSLPTTAIVYYKNGTILTNAVILWGTDDLYTYIEKADTYELQGTVFTADYKTEISSISLVLIVQSGEKKFKIGKVTDQNGKEITSIDQTALKQTFTVPFTNLYSGGKAKVTLYVALYNQNGVLIKTQKVEKDVGSQENITAEDVNLEGAKTIKVLLWNDKLKPYQNTKYFIR